jgi:hypothetical protein
MVAGGPHGAGRAGSRCGLRPRRCSRRTLTPGRSPVPAGEHQVGVPVAARLAGRRRAGPGVKGAWRERLQAATTSWRGSVRHWTPALPPCGRGADQR